MHKGSEGCANRGKKNACMSSWRTYRKCKGAHCVDEEREECMNVKLGWNVHSIVDKQCQ